MSTRCSVFGPFLENTNHIKLSFKTDDLDLAEITLNVSGIINFIFPNLFYAYFRFVFRKLSVSLVE